MRLHPAATVFILALILRLAFALPGLMLDQPQERFSRPDTASYIQPALSLVEYGEYRGEDGTPTAHRPPGFPMLLAVLQFFGGQTFVCIVLILIGTSAVLPVYWSCERFASPAAAAWAAALYALNPTSIAHAPMLLSDTLFAALTAWCMYFLLKTMPSKADLQENTEKIPFTAFAVFFAVCAAYVRPVNLFWIFPAAVLIYFLCSGFSRGKRLLISGGAVLAFVLCLLPWMARNHSIGAGWRFDVSSAVTMRHNAAALESRITGIAEEDVRRKRDNELLDSLPDDPSYATVLDCTEKKNAAYILQHPAEYAAMCIRPYAMIPDIPALMENLGITQSGRGTFDVLNREGIWAAVKHYFNGHMGALAAAVPLMIAALVLYLAALSGIFILCKQKNWILLMFFAVFAVYYLLMVGPVAMPRYHLPALPVLCLLAAIAFQQFRDRYTGKQLLN